MKVSMAVTLVASVGFEIEVDPVSGDATIQPKGEPQIQRTFIVNTFSGLTEEAQLKLIQAVTVATAEVTSAKLRDEAKELNLAKAELDTIYTKASA